MAKQIEPIEEKKPAVPITSEHELLIFVLGALTAMEQSDDIGDALKSLIITVANYMDENV